MTAKLVDKLVEMNKEQFDLLAQVVKSSTEETLANVVEDLIGALAVKSENSSEEAGESQLDEHKNVENETKTSTKSPPKDLQKEIKKKKRTQKKSTDKEKGYTLWQDFVPKCGH